jgi:chromosome segregation ATPase
MGSITYIIFSIAMVSVFLISSCCKPGIRPEDTNILQAACGISSGDFDKQLDDARESASMLDSERHRSEQLQTELVEKQTEYARLQKELDALESSSRKFEQQINAIRAVTNENNEQMHAKLAELERIEEEIAQLKLQKSGMTNEALQQRLDNLRKEVEVLRRISIEQ